MWLREHAPGREFRIFATDISTRVLEQARRGIYPEAKLEGIPAAWRPKYLLRGEGRQAGNCRFRPEVRAMVEFERLNLVRPPLPVHRRFPVIFCRNVMIYFDIPSRTTLVHRLTRQLAPGGYLVIGHSESLLGIRHGLESVRQSVFRRP
jgi:chemotaxis protein methyltransferase CheR